MPKVRRIALFASQVGLYEKDKWPAMDTRDTEFILSLIEGINRDSQSYTSSPSRNRKAEPLSITTRPEIPRVIAENIVKTTLRNWLPDGGEDFIIKVKSMQGTDRSSRFIDIDEFIELMLEPWNLVRVTWEEHARYLYQHHCSVYSVVSEAQFANDSGMRNRDTVVAEVQKALSFDCIRRPLRLFQRAEKAERQDDGGRETKAVLVHGNPNKEPVVELMSKKAFITAMALINPSLSPDKVYIYILLITYSQNKSCQRNS
jgi:hypothetical protein